MAKYINAKSKLYICTDPTQPLQDDVYKEVCSATNFNFTQTYKKTDSAYFCNGGETTSTITGRTQTASVSIDYDDESEAHQYIYKLLTGSFGDANNQYVRIILPLQTGESKAAYYSGKCCFEFKNGIPSGAADELIKIDFDIHAQDSAFTFTPAER